MPDYAWNILTSGIASTIRYRRLSRLLNKAAMGDTEAFAEFYDATASVVYGRALAFAHDAADAEAVVRDVYVTAWTNARAFDASKSTPDHWLASIAASRSGRQTAA